jgi:hypothetical protein
VLMVLQADEGAGQLINPWDDDLTVS